MKKLHDFNLKQVTFILGHWNYTWSQIWSRWLICRHNAGEQSLRLGLVETALHSRNEVPNLYGYWTQSSPRIWLYQADELNSDAINRRTVQRSEVLLWWRVRLIWARISGKHKCLTGQIVLCINILNHQAWADLPNYRDTKLLPGIRFKQVCLMKMMKLMCNRTVLAIQVLNTVMWYLSA